MDFSFPLETEMPIDAFYWCEHAMFDQKRPFPNEDSLLDGNEVPLPSIESLDGKGHSSECTLVKGESAGALKREESITPLFKEFVATMVASPNSSIVKLKIMLDNFPKGTMWLERSGKEVLLKYHLFSVKDYLPQFTHVLPATTMAIFERSLKHAGLRVKQTSKKDGIKVWTRDNAFMTKGQKKQRMCLEEDEEEALFVDEASMACNDDDSSYNN